MKLYNLAKKNKVKLYTNDLEIYKRRKIHIRKQNRIWRLKKDSKKEILYLDLYIMTFICYTNF